MEIMDDKKNFFNKFPKTFWVANTIELFERWAWYGFFMLFATYLTGSTDDGALGFTQEQKGMIMGIGTGILYFLPVITGAIADRYGYKKVLTLAFIIYTTAFVLFPHFDSFGSVFSIYLFLALGAALFKPVISATIAKTTTTETKSIGFGIFYMMVNLGAYFGPMVTLIYKEQSELIFYISACMIAVNFIMLLLYKEPVKTEKNYNPITVYFNIISTLIISIITTFTCFGIFFILWVLEIPIYLITKNKYITKPWINLVNKIPIGESNRTIFNNLTSVFYEYNFVVFLLIVAGFWTMYNQLFFTLPVFITQWVDTSSIYNFFHEYLPFFSKNYGTAAGQMDAEFITNFDALFIILLQIMISTIVMRWRAISTMTAGFVICSIGMALTLLTQNVGFTIAAILIFAIGEMASSPKITEYISIIAPKDKIGLYMGCSFIPVFFGNIFAGIISGNVYGAMSDKVSILKREVAERGLEISETLTQNQYFDKAAELMNFTNAELTQFLWDKYTPSNIWYVLLSIGFMAAFALFIYDKVLRSAAKKEA